MNFVDRAKILVKAGRGGSGCRSFYQDKYTRYPRPDGGDGGKGANIVIRADKNVQTLLDFRFRQHFTAKPGENGSSNKKKGRDSSDTIILVPQGTTITEVLTNCRLRDLISDGQELIVAKGGEGGKGNAHCREDAIEGKAGEEKELILDLRLIADVGLVGFPNSGKSTLISKISGARPKIASYPFTTKVPNLGIVQAGRLRCSVADIPGLIQGSHQGRGLGDRFLRHIERTRILVYLIDMAGVDGREPAVDYKIIRQELKLYSNEVFRKPRILAANKMDLLQARVNLKKFRNSVKEKIITISALKSEGIKELLNAIEKELRTHNG